MPVDSKHPEYNDRIPEWEVCRDCARGETAVKVRSQKFRVYPQAVAATRPAENDDPYNPVDASRQAVVVVGAVARPYYVSEYLPMPDGFRFQNDQGYYLYHQYLNRAQFPEILTPTIGGMVGLIHRKEAVIKVPKALEAIFEKATPDGLSLESFHKRVTRELLTTGRFSILPDFPTDGSSDIPYLAGYVAEALINWNDDDTLFVLDESGRRQSDSDEFEWTDVQRHRVLRLRGEVYTQQVYTGESSGDTFTPTSTGNKSLDFIPLVNVTATDLKTCPETPPLIGVARASLAMFRLDADYRHQLYNTGQETFVISGADGAPEAVGAGVVINLPLGATAQYVGPKGVGISAHRLAISDERANAVVAGAKMFDETKAGVESGEALRIRFAAQGATLVSVALSSAQGIERALKNMAVMVGANPDEVLVTPNLDFVDTALNPKEAAELVKMWQADAMSYETLYENLQRGGIASIERTAEDERNLIEIEPPPPTDRTTGRKEVTTDLPIVTVK